MATRTEELAKSIELLQAEIKERERAEQALRVETSERLQAVELLRQKEQMLVHQSRQAAMGEMIGNIAPSEEAGRAVITVGDKAGGISEEIIGKIFEPYFTTQGPQQGTGVGLFMSKNIIEKNMSGSLTVCNKGKGAEFRIEV